MDGLLKYQIHKNCKLALPEGLKDLMSDISREVLRAQPQNLYQFIANYLGALLEARGTLTIASQVYSDILCKYSCDHIKPELYHELRKIGLDEEDAENAIEVIEKHLKGDEKANKSVKEQSLLLKLLRKPSINETQLPAIQQAIQKAFKIHSLGQDLMDFRNESNKETSEAIHHTLQLHKQNKPKEEKETEEIFVAPDFKPRVTTVSSVSLAGSYVPLPKFEPYSAHDYEILATISEREHVSIDYSNVATTTKPKQKKIEISKETTVIENDEKNEPFVCLNDDNPQNEHNNNESFSIDDYTVATTSTGLKLNRVEVSEEIKYIEKMEEPDKHSVSVDDSSDEMKMEGQSDDEVQESIENIESENESNVSSIGDLLQNYLDD